MDRSTPRARKDPIREMLLSTVDNNPAYTRSPSSSLTADPANRTSDWTSSGWSANGDKGLRLAHRRKQSVTAAMVSQSTSEPSTHSVVGRGNVGAAKPFVSRTLIGSSDTPLTAASNGLTTARPRAPAGDEPPHKLVGWGACKEGQLALAQKYRPKTVNIPETCNFRTQHGGGQISPTGAVQVGAGAKYTVLVTDTGRVWCTGSAGLGSMEAIGAGADGEEVENDQGRASGGFRRVSSLENYRVVSVSCGDFHTAAVTDEGKVYTWGWGKDGRLGHNSTDMSVSPKRVEGISHLIVTQASCGAAHTAAVTDVGTLYTWGCGSLGRLGLGDQTDQSTPCQVTSLSDTSIRAVACGGAHTVALSSNHQLFSWGNNAHGQLGHGGTSLQLVPRRLESFGMSSPSSGLALSEIRTVVTSEHNSYAVSARGDVYSWGRGSDGCLGRGVPLADARKPEKIESLSHVTELSAGDSHVVVCTLDGKVFAWGKNTSGQLGLGDMKHNVVVSTPELVTSLQEHQTFLVACGGAHTIALLGESGDPHRAILRRWHSQSTAIHSQRLALARQRDSAEVVLREQFHKQYEDELNELAKQVVDREDDLSKLRAECDEKNRYIQKLQSHLHRTSELHHFWKRASEVRWRGQRLYPIKSVVNMWQKFDLAKAFRGWIEPEMCTYVGKMKELREGADRHYRESLLWRVWWGFRLILGERKALEHLRWHGYVRMQHMAFEGMKMYWEEKFSSRKVKRVVDGYWRSGQIRKGFGWWKDRVSYARTSFSVNRTVVSFHRKNVKSKVFRALRERKDSNRGKRQSTMLAYEHHDFRMAQMSLSRLRTQVGRGRLKKGKNEKAMGLWYFRLLRKCLDGWADGILIGQHNRQLTAYAVMHWSRQLQGKVLQKLIDYVVESNEWRERLLMGRAHLLQLRTMQLTHHWRKVAESRMCAREMLDKADRNWERRKRKSFIRDWSRKASSRAAVHRSLFTSVAAMVRQKEKKALNTLRIHARFKRIGRQALRRWKLQVYDWAFDQWVDDVNHKRQNRMKMTTLFCNMDKLPLLMAWLTLKKFPSRELFMKSTLLNAVDHFHQQRRQHHKLAGAFDRWQVYSLRIAVELQEHERAEESDRGGSLSPMRSSKGSAKLLMEMEVTAPAAVDAAVNVIDSLLAKLKVGGVDDKSASGGVSSHYSAARATSLSEKAYDRLALDESEVVMAREALQKLLRDVSTLHHVRQYLMDELSRLGDAHAQAVADKEFLAEQLLTREVKEIEQITKLYS